MDRLLSVVEVAAMLGLSRHTIYTWVSKRKLPIVKVGSRTMFQRSEIERWIVERHRREHLGEAFPVMQFKGTITPLCQRPGCRRVLHQGTESALWYCFFHGRDGVTTGQ